MLKEIVAANRSYRRFDQSRAVSLGTLRELVDLARLTPSTANLQPLKYYLSAAPDTNELIFPHLAWAGYLKEWPGPAEGEKPPAYITVMKDTSISRAASCDHGIAAQTILLGAVEKGLGGCIIGNLKRDALAGDLGLPDHLEIQVVLALGKPVEDVILEPVGPGGDMKYWRDEAGGHHVPKRGLDDIIWP